MKFLEEARAYQDNMIADLRELVKIESVRDDAAATKEAPFGPNIAKCLDKALEIGKRDGFQVENVDGYAGVIQYGNLEESVGILGHLDIVPIGDGWHFDPLAGEIKENNPKAYDFLESTFPSSQYEWIETSHEAFKEATKQCKCIIRTGEASPYANIILRADCIFSDRP